VVVFMQSKCCCGKKAVIKLNKHGKPRRVT
jgi:hypothetical protein